MTADPLTHWPEPLNYAPSSLTATSSGGLPTLDTVIHAIIDGQAWDRTLRANVDGWQALDWVDMSPPIAGISVMPTVLSVTFASIGYAMTWTETTEAVTDARCHYRKLGEAIWLEGIAPPIVRQTGVAPAAYGSVLLCDPGTTYELRLRLWGTTPGTRSTWVGTATTRAEKIPTVASLVQGADWRYVDPVLGNDANDGTSASPWKTYHKLAISYPTGGTQAAPKYGRLVSGGAQVYLCSANEQLNRGTLVLTTDAPAVDDNRVETTGGRVTIEPSAVTAPSGTVVTDSWVTVAPWQSVNLVGPGLYNNTPGTLYQVWKWTGAPVALPTQGSYGTSRSGRPLRLPHCGRTHVDLNTPEKWAEAIYTNRIYRFGFYEDGAGTIYVRLPGDLDPRTLWTWFGAGAGVDMKNAGSRASGMAVHTFQVGIQSSNSVGAMVVDHVLVRNCYRGIQVAGTGNADTVVEQVRYEDGNLWADQAAGMDPKCIAWKAIKEALIMANGATTVSKWMANSESTAVYVTGGARRVVVRRCTLTDGFNGIGVPGPSANSATRTWGDNCDVYECEIARMSDDALEPEGTVVNFRAWANRMDRTLSGISLGPLHVGPAYCFWTTFVGLGSAGTGRAVDGTTRPAGKCIKFSIGSAPQARLYFLGNSVDISQTSPNTVMFAGDSAGGAIKHEAFTLIDNIITCSSYPIDAQVIGEMVEHHNVLATSDVTRGIRLQATATGTRTDYNNTSPSLNFAAYRAASGQGDGTNLDGGVAREVNDPTWLAYVRAQWPNRATGDLTLDPLSPLRTAGVVIPNLHSLGSVVALGAPGS